MLVKLKRYIIKYLNYEAFEYVVPIQHTTLNKQPLRSLDDLAFSTSGSHKIFNHHRLARADSCFWCYWENTKYNTCWNNNGCPSTNSKNEPYAKIYYFPDSCKAQNILSSLSFGSRARNTLCDNQTMFTLINSIIFFI